MPIDPQSNDLKSLTMSPKVVKHYFVQCKKGAGVQIQPLHLRWGERKIKTH